MFFPGLVVPGLAEHDRVIILRGHVFDALDHRGEKILGEAGQDDADGESLFLFEIDGRLVWFVVQLAGQLLHPHPCSQTDAVVIMEGPGDGGHRNLELAGDLFKRGWLVGHSEVLVFLKIPKKRQRGAANGICTID